MNHIFYESWCQSWMIVSTGRRNYLKWLDWLDAFVKQGKDMCKQWFRRNHLLSNQHLKMLPDLPANAAYVGIFCIRPSFLQQSHGKRKGNCVWNTDSLHAGLHGISFPSIVSLFTSTLCAFASFYLSVVLPRARACSVGEVTAMNVVPWLPHCFATSDE